METFNLNDKLLRLTSLLLGGAILSFGLFNIHSQSLITEGGVLGMTLLLNRWLGISPGIIGLVLDILCYAVGFKYLGKTFLYCALIASTGFAVSYSIFENIGYSIPSLIDFPIIAALLGGVFIGVGVGIVIRAGGAAGGDDVIALIIEKYTPLSLTKAYLISDLVVLTLSLSYIPFNKIFYSLITVTVSSYVIGIIRKIRLPSWGILRERFGE